MLALFDLPVRRYPVHLVSLARQVCLNARRHQAAGQARLLAAPLLEPEALRR